MKNDVVIALEGPQLEALELLSRGLIPGVDGYVLPGSPMPAAHLRVAAKPAIAVGTRVVLSDHENTPLAEMRIEDLAFASECSLWLEGAVYPLRDAEHGPARECRLEAGADLSGGIVAVFSPGSTPADILSVVRDAQGGRLNLIAEGTLNRVESAKLVSELSEVAELSEGTRVYFVPQVDLGEVGADVTAAVLAGLGARAIVDRRHRVSEYDGGAVVLFTGLSGSGKSTIARAVADYLGAHSARRPVLLDGDHVRQELASELGFSAGDRHLNLVRQAWVGARVAEAGGIALCAPIAPFRASRAAMRGKVEPQSLFVTVYVSTPLDVAETRDRKGLYAKARAGLISEFTGIGSPYEVPTDADLAIDASELSVDQCVAEVVALLKSNGVI